MIGAERVDFVAVPVRDLARANELYGAIFSDSDGNGLMLHRRYAPLADGRTP